MLTTVAIDHAPLERRLRHTLAHAPATSVLVIVTGARPPASLLTIVEEAKRSAHVIVVRCCADADGLRLPGRRHSASTRVLPGRLERRSLMRRVPQLLVVAAFVIVAVLGFHGSLDGWGFLLPACTGTIVALIALLVAKHYRLYVRVGGAVGRAVRRRRRHRDRRFVSRLLRRFDRRVEPTCCRAHRPPLTHELAVLPYAVAWSAMLIGGELSRRAAQPMLPIIGPIGDGGDGAGVQSRHDSACSRAWSWLLVH
ncbi:MAG: hypothetical protein R2710_29075 [Acidimicrobiales bacterium]